MPFQVRSRPRGRARANDEHDAIDLRGAPGAPALSARRPWRGRHRRHARRGLAAFEPAFGVPRRILLALSLVAASFAAYSLTCHLRAASARMLLGIPVANTAYCLCTLGLVVRLRGSLTWLGVAYFWAKSSSSPRW